MNDFQPQSQFARDLFQRNYRPASANPSQRFNDTGYVTQFVQEEDYNIQSNHANSQEQVALRRWFQNKFYDGKTEDRNHMNTEEFIQAVRTYQTSQQVSSEVILRNIGLNLLGDAKRWWTHRQEHTKSLAEFETRIRARFSPSTRDVGSVVAAVHKMEQQPGETLGKYLDNILILMGRAPGQWSDFEQMKIIIRGLSNEWHSYFVGKTFIHMEDFMNFCDELIHREDAKPKKKVEFAKRPSVQYERKVHAAEITYSENEECEFNSGDESESELVQQINALQRIVANKKFDKKPRRIWDKPRQVTQPVATTDATAPIVEQKPPEMESKLSEEIIGEGSSICFNCLHYGHHHDYCPFPKRIFCFGCGRPKTFIKDCVTCQARIANLPKNLNGHRISANSMPQPKQ